MADQMGQRGPADPTESRQQEQKKHQDNTQVHSPASTQSNFHQPPPQQYYFKQHQQIQHTQQQFSPNLQQHYRPQGHANARHGQYDMNAMAQSPPKMDYRQQSQYGAGNRGYNSGVAASSNSPGHTGHPGSQFATHSGSPAPIQTFFVSQQPPMMAQHYYGSPVPTMQPAGPPAMSSRHGGYGYYPNQAPTPTYYYAQPPQYNHQQHVMHHSGLTGGLLGSYPSPAYAPRRASQPMVATGSVQQGGMEFLQKSKQQFEQGQGQTPTTSVVRGPPRKPRQSGHAIWIGNLPPQTNLMSLVHHVCQQTTGLESLFLISKSNCAFANYPDEESCLVAQQKLNDTWYMSVRLVSRLRKNAVEGVQGVTAPTGPTALTAGSIQQQHATPHLDGNPANAADPGSETTNADVGGDVEKPKKPNAQTSVIVDGSGKSRSKGKSYKDEWASTTPTSRSPDAAAKSGKYFILKSLTVEDLELSVRTGIWATQSHNEETLNAAFKSCENVYLVFSANKSGEYFGYARMTSEINEDPAAAIEFAPMAQAFNDVDLPKVIPTEATETTPRGRIIDDSARGTIFWEAQRDEAGMNGQEVGEDVEEEESVGVFEGEQGKVVNAMDGEDRDEAAVGDVANDAAGVKGAGAESDGADGVDGVDSVDVVDGVDGFGDTDGTDGIDGADGVDGADEPKTWGKPFQLEWLSTTRLPFYRTRGMRNPLNANREIKIARDGTEVDATIGRKLVDLFHHGTANSPAAGGGGRPAMQTSKGYSPLQGIRPSQ